MISAHHFAWNTRERERKRDRGHKMNTEKTSSFSFLFPQKNSFLCRGNIRHVNGFCVFVCRDVIVSSLLNSMPMLVFMSNCLLYVSACMCARNTHTHIWVCGFEYDCMSENICVSVCLSLSYKKIQFEAINSFLCFIRTFTNTYTRIRVFTSIFVCVNVYMHLSVRVWLWHAFTYTHSHTHRWVSEFDKSLE